jgi:copper(I)-binding protein
MKGPRGVQTVLAALLLLGLGVACTAQRAPQIVVKGATVQVSDTLKGSASSFMFVINDGRGEDRLLACVIKEHPSVYVELHDIVGGKMIMVKEIEIPARKTTALKRGGLHIMFTGFPEEYEKKVTLILTFEKSGPIEVNATVLS